MQREGRGEGGGLTIVGVQKGQGALSAPIHPSLRQTRERQREKRERRKGESVREKGEHVSGCEELKAAKSGAGDYGLVFGK